MRVKFDYPAVITGTWENGHIRHELVRVHGEFEVVELSDNDAPPSFEVIDQNSGTVLGSYVTFGGRHYKAWRLDPVGKCLAEDSNLVKAIYTGAQFEFRGLGEILKEEAVRVSKITRYRNIENTDRKPLRREAEAGYDAWSISCKKAPLLKRWQWLGPDVADETAKWHAKAADTFSRIILVNGVPHVLSFEPCYRLTASDTLSQNRSGVGAAAVASVAVYGDHRCGRTVEPDTGLEVLGYDALMIGEQFFAANDLEGMERFAAESGWGMQGGSSLIKVLDNSAVSQDFFDLETVRHARILLDRARLMLSHTKQVDGVDWYADRPIVKEDMLARMESLKLSILEWQERREGTERLSAPFEDLLNEMCRWEEGRPRPFSFFLMDQINAFKVREDMAEVSIVPSPWSGATPR